MVLNRNTGILVYFSVSEVIDNAARENKMKVFVYAIHCVFYYFSLIVCKYSYAEFVWLKRITLCFDSCDSTKGIKWHNA